MKKLTKEQVEEIKSHGYLHYFDWQMYIIVCLSYLFGFIAGWSHGWIILISLIFYAYPFYLKSKYDKQKF